jgi:anti-anti-sigma regulatory factor
MDVSQTGAAIAAVGAMAYGSHCCFIADGEDVTRIAVAGYVLDGLAAGDRVLCVLGRRERSWLTGCLRWARLPVDAHLADGSLVIADMSTTPMWQGDFSAVGAAGIMFGAIDGALADGFRGLRVFSDMSWGPVHQVTVPDLIEMERLLEAGLPGRRGMGMCFYDLGAFTLDEIGERACHHALVAGPFSRQTSILQILETDRGLRLIGEADLTTKGQLESALGNAVARAAPGADVVLDVSSLDFADTGSMEAVFEAAARLGPGRQVVVRHPSAIVRMILSVIGPGSQDSGVNVRTEPDPSAGGGA